MCHSRVSGNLKRWMPAFAGMTEEIAYEKNWE
jgi:hypothetical protein